MNRYEISMEIAGSTAMWTRPDTGDCPVSYPVPTYSAVKAVFEAILWGPAIEIKPTKVEVCAPVQFHSYQTNYGGPLRKTAVIQTNGSYQLLATVLIDVCYRFYAEVFPVRADLKEKITSGADLWDKKTSSPGHAYQEIFNRRIKRGQCFMMPFLGWKEFGPSYFGPFRQHTSVQSDLNLIIPSLFREVFPNGYDSFVEYRFDNNVIVDHGLLNF